MMNLLRPCIVLFALALPLQLLAEPLTFNKTATIPGKNTEQVANILTDFDNKCETGCKYTMKNLVQGIVLEKTADHLLIWQDFKELQPTTHFRELTLVRSEGQLTIHARFPDADAIAAYEAKYARKHNTKLTKLDEDWVLQAGNLQTTVTFSSVLDTPLLSIPYAKRMIMENYNRSLEENFGHLGLPLDVPLLKHQSWQAVAPDKDIFQPSESQKICPAGTWVVEDDATEIKTGLCNYLTLTQPMPMKIPAGTQLRFVMWHNNLTSPAPATGHVGIALKKTIVWQKEIAIPSDPQSYEAVITLHESMAVGDPIDVHIDNHGSNSWTVYSLEWITPGTRSKQAVPTYYGDVKPVFDAYCVSCHTKGGPSPFTLDNYANAKTWGFAIKSATAKKAMPPWGLDPVEGYQYKYDLSLTPELIDRISRWVDGGRVMGDPAQEGQPIVLQKAKVEHIDQVLPMTEPHKVKLAGTEADEYRCFPIGEALKEDTYITGYKIVPSNTSIVHHATVYYLAPDLAYLLDEMEATDPAYGYNCYGAPVADGFEGLPVTLVAVAGNSSSETLFPNGSGVKALKGTRFMIQMHYTLAGLKPTDNLEDQTQFQIQTSPSVKKQGVYLPIFDIQWMLPGGMKIPAGEKNVKHAFVKYPPAAESVEYYTQGFDFSKGVLIHTVGPHMHKFGTGSQYNIVRENGVTEPFVNMTRWNYAWQREYILSEPILIKPSEQIDMSCIWDNSPANQPVINGQKRVPQDIFWGNNALDEMCVGTFFVTEP